jgi:RNA polymerase sigma factor (sigma-70 family)
MDPLRVREEEFKEIVDAYGHLMNLQIQQFNLLKHGLDPEDILQDVKIRIWKIIQEKRLILSPASYIKKIVSSAVIDQLRKLRRDDDLFRYEKQKRISEEGFSYSGEAVRKKAFKESVGLALERLIDSRRQVVKLYLLGLTVQEIAGYLKWSQAKTRNLLYRGLADLKRTLKDMEAKHENRQR